MLLAFFCASQWSARVQTFSVNHTCQQVRHSFGRAWYLPSYLFWCPVFSSSRFRDPRSCLMRFYVLHLGQYLPDIKIQRSLCSKWSSHVTCTFRRAIIFQFDDVSTVVLNETDRLVVGIAKIKFNARLLILKFTIFRNLQFLWYFICKQ